jgi:hypothetical protein
MNGKISDNKLDVLQAGGLLLTRHSQRLCRARVINKCNLLILMIFCLCSCHSVKGQQDNNFAKYDSLTQQSVYLFVEKMPDYKGGDRAFMADFGKLFHYDFAKNAQEPIQTKLRVQFVIDTEGNLIGARVCDKQANELTDFEKAGLKALNLMQSWQSGEHNGKLVNVLITKIIHVDYQN